MKKDKLVSIRINSKILEAMTLDGIKPLDIINKYIEDNYEIVTTVVNKEKESE